MTPDIPPFLIRKPGDQRTAFSADIKTTKRKPIKFGPIATANIERIVKSKGKFIARPLVLKAVKNGADTFGKIKQISGVEEDKFIRSALRYFVKNSRIEKVGRRYYTSF